MAKHKKNKKKIWIVVGVIVLAIIVAVILFLNWKPVKETVSLEVGESIALTDFMNEENEHAAFETDISTINTSVLGEHSISIKIFLFTYESTLKIVDTVAPTATAVPLSVENGTLPDVMECVTEIVDKTNVTVEYKETPDTTVDGDLPVIVVLTDEGGNVTEIETTFSVWSDTEAPVIHGAGDKVVTIGGSISYRKGVTVEDNMDENPSLEIDNSKVNLNKVGDYEVVYTATDKSGNVTTKTIIVHVVEKQVVQVDEATVNALAQQVLSRITNESMSKMQVAFAIYRWTATNIGYTGKSDKTNWMIGAYQAFTKKSGDCYNYFAAAKALFRVAGIENVDVVKSDTSHSRHYWSLINLGYGWYHVDCTPRKGDGDLFFMVTDAELLNYSAAHNNSHIFDPALYPERAVDSVQYKVNYAAGTVSE